ncbi:uncharacterized protein LOC142235317 [Haematobia irritans]|uniref:uncharacterized protein LOC142235317 n=1 Tax=Haematobia irritans TaxID=7368 RepID=UPI003F50AA19
MSAKQRNSIKWPQGILKAEKRERSPDELPFSKSKSSKLRLSFGEYTLAAFLAFNNTKIEKVVLALERNGVSEIVTNWIEAMLRSRNIEAEFADSKQQATTTRGLPQGGVISPVLWLIIVDEILSPLSNRGIKVVAYSDDIVSMVSGKFLDTISDVMSDSLKSLAQWASGGGLGVNPRKTDLVLFTRKRRLHGYKDPEFQGTS